MSISIKNLILDAWNFFVNQIINIIFFSTISAIISSLINYIFLPNRDELFTLANLISDFNGSINNINYLFQKMSIEQKYILFKLSLSNHLSSLVGNAFLFSNIITMINTICDKKRFFNIFNNIILSSSLIPKFLTLIFLISFLTQCGMALMLIPGIIVLIFLSFSPILITKKNISITDSIKISVNITFKNIKTVAPIIFLWLLIKLIILVISSQISINGFLSSVKIFFYLINNIITVYIIIYMYRLYLLSKIKKNKYL
ncbi:yciC [Wigglesworthia glossinidia endosymbiont of Glossina brevipalpis]|uniref:UPF0259 membrane protein WIGBR3650 n=1 Tax=Wigglesworthia glossinidia brevipalpis TaxID=36870 RepID=Y365_WIGBR|nr:RecName: Full=UPF0259 membrane protein WIGBR3650 [Wigglesworthia glossinidia endosymbiont of Glossina brevipalpis]BAC24511.1 yciC [Wigglesworthia glossinidia endosymbiont of Glossina brevipalpis]